MRRTTSQSSLRRRRSGAARKFPSAFARTGGLCVNGWLGKVLGATGENQILSAWPPCPFTTPFATFSGLLSDSCPLLARKVVGTITSVISAPPVPEHPLSLVGLVSS